MGCGTFLTRIFLGRTEFNINPFRTSKKGYYLKNYMTTWGILPLLALITKLNEQQITFLLKYI